MDESNKTKHNSGRLIDEIVNYVRSRYGQAEGENRPRADDERVLRAAIRQLRKHPVPTALLGISTVWLLLATDNEGGEDDPQLSRQIEEEVVGQIKGGYAYTGQRLREVTDRYPWAAGAALIAAGLGAAFLAPGRRRRISEDDEDVDLGAEDPAPGDVFDFKSSGEDEEPPVR